MQYMSRAEQGGHGGWSGVAPGRRGLRGSHQRSERKLCSVDLWRPCQNFGLDSEKKNLGMVP